MNLGEKIQSLYQKFGVIKGISIECQKELIAIGVVNKAARAEVFLQGAQVSGYQKHGEKPRLFLSKECVYKKGSPLRGGIPICWPWFGDLEKNNQSVKNQFSNDYIALAPAHGFVRDIDWDLDSIDIIDDSNTLLVFTLKLEKDNPFGWPFSAMLTYEILIGESLQVKLGVKNTGDKTFVQSSALHTYFAVEDINDASINGLNGIDYIDAMKDWQRFEQIGKLCFSEEIDRIYQFGSSSNIITLLEGNQKISLSSLGSASAIVWNPWIEKSKRLSQFADEDYKQMVCIETANAGDDVITIEPGFHHELSLIIA